MVMSVRRNFVKTRGMPGDCLDCLGHSVAWDTRRVLAEMACEGMACEGNPSAALDSVLYLAVSMRIEFLLYAIYSVSKVHFKLSPTAAALRMRQVVAAPGVCRSLDGSSGWLEMVRSRSKVRPDLSCLSPYFGASIRHYRCYCVSYRVGGW